MPESCPNLSLSHSLPRPRPRPCPCPRPPPAFRPPPRALYLTYHINTHTPDPDFVPTPLRYKTDAECETFTPLGRKYPEGGCDVCEGCEGRGTGRREEARAHVSCNLCVHAVAVHRLALTLWLLMRQPSHVQSTVLGAYQTVAPPPPPRGG